MTETKKELLEFFSMAIAALGIFVVFALAYMNSIQKDTCRRTIEFSLVISINRNEINLETPVTHNWQKLNSDEQSRFLQFVQERESDYTECGEHSYLIKGKEYEGSNLSFSARKNDYDQLEIMLSR